MPGSNPFDAPEQSSSAVEAALDLVGAGPASGAGVLAVGDGLRARPAPDRLVALLAERVNRQAAGARVGVSARRGPVLHPAAPAGARRNGSILRAAQQPSGSSAQRSSGCTSGRMIVRFMPYRSRSDSMYSSVSGKW